MSCYNKTTFVPHWTPASVLMAPLNDTKSIRNNICKNVGFELLYEGCLLAVVLNDNFFIDDDDDDDDTKNLHLFSLTSFFDEFLKVHFIAVQFS